MGGRATNREKRLLVAEVRARPALWDDRHQHFKKASITRRLWEQIGDVLHLPGSVVKTKWKSMKDRFRREIQKCPIRPDMDRHDYSSKWEFFEMMLFVKDVISPKSSGIHLSRNEHLSSEEDTNRKYNDFRDVKKEESEVDDSEYVENSNQLNLFPSLFSHQSLISSQSISSTSLDQSRSQKRKIRDIAIESLVLQQKRLLNTIATLQSQISNIGTDYQFLISLLPYIENLDPVKKLEVRNKIQQVVLEAYRNHI
ncbi:uncharacterized protein LOC143917602 [Arctopsyche grandis]|uniref:uncharacterized protein LOC143917602 n=1 Tax=Arctopsyche grandis TaxID=121162 RepID=UPI00406D9813